MSFWRYAGRALGTLQLAGGVFLLAYTSQGWLWASGGLFLCGSGVRYWAFDPLFENGQRVLRFSLARGFRLMCIAYIAAGICAIVGLFRLNVPFAAFVSPFLLVWVGLWVSALRVVCRDGFSLRRS